METLQKKNPKKQTLEYRIYLIVERKNIGHQTICFEHDDPAIIEPGLSLFYKKMIKNLDEEKNMEGKVLPPRQ